MNTGQLSILFDIGVLFVMPLSDDGGFSPIFPHVFRGNPPNPWDSTNNQARMSSVRGEQPEAWCGVSTAPEVTFFLTGAAELLICSSHPVGA
jgi:hypothetical protein